MTTRLQPSVLLFRGRGIVSTLIRWQTRGRYSHAALLTPGGEIIESWQFAGVRIKTITDWRDVDRFTIPSMSGEQWNRALDFALSQVGKRYDYVGVARFISRERSPDNGRWFCSELVDAALRHAGVHLFERIESAEISPGLLAISPLLSPAPMGDGIFNR
jgi:uncharacterized protein YycO